MFLASLIVSRFVAQLKKSPDLQNKYIFAVATYGGVAGNALGQMKREIASAGGCLNAGFCVKMPGNYTPLYGAISQEKQIKMFDAMEKRIEHIAEIIRERKISKIEKSFFLFNLLGNAIYKIGMPSIMEEDKWFVAEENCNGCGTCAKVCPVADIVMVNQKPVWLHHCEQCMACLQWCPQEAIQMGKLTKNRKRYHHPEVNVKDFIY
ncbi:MAG TPA: EFR1 family ferrodoxin [Candidatus Omnitrophota bacterium]|nr:EFR1 family ferrodoxin [Candidatus Omnitrophota bacterium]